MERLLLFCGVWIIIVPILFQNSYFEEHKKYTLSMQIKLCIETKGHAGAHTR